MPRLAAPPPIAWDGRELRILDQTLLPAREEVLVLRDPESVAMTASAAPDIVIGE